MPVSSTAAQAKPETTERRELMPGVAWRHDGKGLIAVTEKAKTKLRREELSASTMTALGPRSCSVSMVADRLLPRNDDLFEQNQLGTAAHGVLEHLFSLDAEQRTKGTATITAVRFTEDAEFAQKYLDKDLVTQIHGLDDDGRSDWLSEVNRRVLGLWGIENPEAVHVMETEMAFGKRHNVVVELGGVPFVGFIDRVDLILDPVTGEIIGYNVIDYKAGKAKLDPGRFEDDYGDQIRLYVAAVFALLGIKPTNGSLYFITHGVVREVDVGDEAVARAVARYRSAWDKMHRLADDNFYPATPNALCGWCPLVNACPTAIKAKKTDLSNTEKDEKTKQRYVVPGKRSNALDPADLAIPTLPAPGADDSPHTAHRTGEPNERTPTVSTIFKSGNSRDATIDGALNPESPTATAVFGITGLAVELIAKNLDESHLTAPKVRGLAFTLARVVQNVEFALTGTSSYQSGLNTRLRGALRCAIEQVPAPWGGDAAAWDGWQEKLTKRVKATAVVSAQLFEAGSLIPESPWEVMAS